MSSELFTFSWGPSALAWLGTYAIHSTVLLSGAFLVNKILRARPHLASTVWKSALVGGVLTATVQIGLGVDPFIGRMRVDALQSEGPEGSSGPVARRASSEGRDLPESSVTDTSPEEKTRGCPGAVAHGPGPGGPLPGSPAPWVEWLGGTWLVGALIGLVGLVWSWSSMRRRLAALPRCASDHLQSLLPDSAVRVRLRVVRGLDVPIAEGIVAPTIWVPERVSRELSPAACRALLAHELGHVVHRDPLWRWMAMVLGRVFFFQPLNRVAARALAQTAELRADEWAAARTAAPLALAECLTEVAGWFSPRSWPLASTMGGTRSMLSTRVMRLVEPPPGFGRRTSAAPAAASTSTVLAVAVWMLPGLGQAHSEGDTPSAEHESARPELAMAFVPPAPDVPAPPAPPRAPTPAVAPPPPSSSATRPAVPPAPKPPTASRRATSVAPEAPAPAVAPAPPAAPNAPAVAPVPPPAPKAPGVAPAPPAAPSAPGVAPAPSAPSSSPVVAPAPPVPVRPAALPSAPSPPRAPATPRATSRSKRALASPPAGAATRRRARASRPTVLEFVAPGRARLLGRDLASPRVSLPLDVELRWAFHRVELDEPLEGVRVRRVRETCRRQTSAG